MSVAGCLVVSAAGAAHGAPVAPAAPDGPGVHSHDGVYLRGFGGVGGLSLSASQAGDSVDITGHAAVLGVAAGHSVTDSLVVFAEVFDAAAANPEVRFNGKGVSTGEFGIGVLGVGPGIAYYFNRQNLYVSATASLVKASVLSQDSSPSETRWGGAVSLMLGKEWWVSPQLGVGASLQIFAGSMKDTDDLSPTWNVRSLAVGLSATYN